MTRARKRPTDADLRRWLRKARAFVALNPGSIEMAYAGLALARDVWRTLDPAAYAAERGRR